MDLKKKIRAFFTLTRKANDGFTLVELIVVIAILAILGGVAVPAYSGYVEKANKTADLQLISDIEHALTLAGYNGTFADGESAYITLSADGIVNADNIQDGSALDTAMKATFGAGYKDSLKLAYDDWGSNGLIDGLLPARAMAVSMSSYMTGTRSGVLLNDVERMTDMAQKFVSVLGSNEAEGTTLSDLFGETVLSETAKKYGITLKEGETWDTWGSTVGNETAYSNLLVLAAADEAEKYMNGEITLGEMSTASNLILEFSTLYAYAATNETFDQTMDDYLSTVGTVTSKDEGKAWFDGLKAAAGPEYDAYLDEQEATKAMMGNGLTLDQTGFLSIMAGIGNPTEEQASAVAADLNNVNLFTSGVVNGMYNDYLDAVDAMSGLVGDENLPATGVVSPGQVAILFVLKDGAPITVSSLPGES